MAALTPAEIAAEKAFKNLQLQAEAQERLNKGTAEYFTLIKEIGKIQKNIDHLQKARAKVSKEYLAALKSGNQDDIEAAIAKAKLFDEEIKNLRELNDEYIRLAKTQNKAAIAAKVIFGGLVKLPSMIKGAYSTIQMSGLFDMDKAIKNAALEMGILSKQTNSFRAGITQSVMGLGLTNKSTLALGVGVEELAKLQADYSNELGRNVTFTDEANQAMAELAKGTGLGFEGASEMAAQMDSVGFSAKETRDYIQDSMNDAHGMGLNASKVVKNISTNLGLLNQYRFSNGTKGLADMALAATKLGISMGTVAPMADKLFDIEGAVDMSAQLQVLGGEWSKLADPFKLMYMARNDMDGLFKSIVNATKGAAQFNKETGNFDISSMELSKLRIVAQETGISFDDLATASKKAAKFSNIEGQISIPVDDSTKEFIDNISKFDKNGAASINIKGVDKLVSALNTSDLQSIADMKNEKATLEQRAKDAMTFDEQLGNTINLFKTAMLPIVENINEVLMPFVNDIFKNKDFKQQLSDLGKDIGSFVNGAASIIKTVGEIAIALGPTGTLYTILAGGILFDSAKWLANGISLGTGFNAVAGGSGSLASIAGTIGKSLGKTALGLAGAGIGVAGGTAAGGGGTGSMIGSTAGTALGALGYLIPGWGFLAGPALMALGGMAGGWIGGQFDDKPAVNDGIFTSPLHDGMIPSLGNDFSKGRGIIQGGQITPIDNKDDLIAAKPNGIIDNSTKNNTPSDINVNFGELKLTGSIELTSAGNSSVTISDDLLKNPSFVRELSRLVNMEVSKSLTLKVSNGKQNA